MTPDQQNKLEAMKAALKQHIEESEKATPGPWFAKDPHDSYCGSPYCQVNGCPENHPSGEIVLGGPDYDGFQDEPNRMHPKDATFIARARTMSPLACNIALAGIECAEQHSALAFVYGIPTTETQVQRIIDIWEGGQP